MKKVLLSVITVLILCAGLAGLSSCNKIKDLASVNFTLDNAEGEFTIPVLTTTGTETFNADQVYINLDSLIKDQNQEVNAGLIKEVRIISCSLELLNSDEQNNFSVLESCKLALASNVNPDFITIAEISNNPDEAKDKLELPLSNPELELKDYFISATQFSYRVVGTTRKTTDKELQCRVRVQYRIKAGL